MERFVLAYPDELELSDFMTEQKLEELVENSNLVEVLIDRVNKLTNKPSEVLTSTIICDNKIKASVIFNDRHVIEILENQQALYKKNGATEWSLRKRGRLAEELVSKNKQYASYSCISYVELEAATNEEELFDLLTRKAVEDINMA